MVFSKKSPRIDNILWLVKLARPFPATAKHILAIAKVWNFSQSTLNFLELFSPNEVFENGDDFLARCEELEIIATDKEDMSRELLHGPQTARLIRH